MWVFICFKTSSQLCLFDRRFTTHVSRCSKKNAVTRLENDSTWRWRHFALTSKIQQRLWFRVGISDRNTCWGNFYFLLTRLWVYIVPRAWDWVSRTFNDVVIAITSMTFCSFRVEKKCSRDKNVAVTCFMIYSCGTRYVTSSSVCYHSMASSIMSALFLLSAPMTVIESLITSGLA